jgi:hypothetical protein
MQSNYIIYERKFYCLHLRDTPIFFYLRDNFTPFLPSEEIKVE